VFLNIKETPQLAKRFAGSMFFYVKICQSCYIGANFGSWLEDNLLETDDFELVQIATSKIMHD